MQIDNHIFKGLKRGTHQIKQDPEYLWDAHNIRLTRRDDDTLLSITNEKGTSEPLLNFDGEYVGHCVLGKYLIVFTAEDDGTSFIYRVNKVDTGYIAIILYKGDLGLSPNNPIETLSLYETDLVQKVYWIDIEHQPRVINITYPELKFPEDSYAKVMQNGVILSEPRANTDSIIEQELSYLDEKGLLMKSNSFDFIRALSLNEEVVVNRVNSVGMFSPGTIQYAFTYYNKYDAESNIFYTTPIQYISFNDRAGNGEEKVSCGFNISISNLDKFDYVRVYSIHRSSIDSIPEVKLLTDIPISSRPGIVTYTDTGTTGSIVDPTYLLYVGGKGIRAGCMAQKSGTLFLGNITINNESRVFSNIFENKDIEFTDCTLSVLEKSVPDNSYYQYKNSLVKGFTAAFKTKETYRCGIQIQNSKGIWSEPIYLKDTILTDTYPVNKIMSKSAVIPKGVVNALLNKGAVNIRTCIVFPRSFERERICQGVLCPTVYGVNSRLNNAPYVMSSWFIRPAMDSTVPSNYNPKKGEFVEFRHNHALLGNTPRGVEIQSMADAPSGSTITSLGTVPEEIPSYFFVDENIVTFHSPDIELNEDLHSLNWDNARLEVIGVANLSAISGDLDIRTSSPVYNPASTGFIHTPIGFTFNDAPPNNGGLISGLFYNDAIVRTIDNGDLTSTEITNYMVYPWNKSGSLNSDKVRETGKGVRSAVLSKKVWSNLKFFASNKVFNSPIKYNISTPQLFSSDEVSLLKVKVPYINTDVYYYGNVDTLLTQTTLNNNEFKGYSMYAGEGLLAETPEAIKDLTFTDAIRMKYKSTPHLVFSLGDNASNISLLPRYTDLERQTGEFTIPSWWNPNKESYIPNSVGEIRRFNWDAAEVYIEDNEKLKQWDFVYTKLEDGTVGYKAYYTQPVGNTSPYLQSPKRLTDFTTEEIIVKTSSKTTVLLRKDTDNNLVGLPGIENNKDNYTPIGGPSTHVYYSGDTKYFKLVPCESDSTLCTLVPLAEPTKTRAGIETNKVAIDQKWYPDDEGQSSQISPYVLLAELVRDIPEEVKFGGTSKEAIRNNLWLPSGKPVPLIEDTDVQVPYEYGDTWFGRYDCLKTYPFTPEDENQIVEIGSFLCESRINLDGRWDRNRGQISNLNMSPRNFNMFNEVYSQKDNFFNYRVFDDLYYKQELFANQILWSKQKILGEDVDTWTNITAASVFDLDGDKGAITSLNTFNGQLLCFQEKALTLIGFDERVQIPTSDGNPIEISNNYKLTGSTPVSSTIGCQDKWTICESPSGLYFVDYNTHSIWLYNGKLTNISNDNGMMWWLKDNTWGTWKPINKATNGLRTFYDINNMDVYFTPGPLLQEQEALCYSELIQGFTSFMSYGGTQAMFNFDKGFYSLKAGTEGLRLYQNNVGKYNYFYGTTKGWRFSFISNSNPSYTKIFNNIELRADLYSETNKLLNTCPFNFIEVSNEYQSAESSITSSNMKKRFRVWRGLIPRASKLSSLGEETTRTYGRARIRNPWTMITLGWNPDTGSKTNKAVIHDVSVKYNV